MTNRPLSISIATSNFKHETLKIMKKIILFSLMLACQGLYAAPVSKASALAAKATQTSKAPAKKAEKAKPVAEKKAAKPETKKTTDAKKKAEPVKAKKDKASEKKPVLAKADKKPEKANKPKTAEAKKTVAQKNEKARDKASLKNKNDKKAVAVATKDKTKPSDKNRETAASGTSSARATLLNHGKKFIGTPYVWGGASPKGFDCSGLVHYLYQKQGVSIPRNSREQFSRLPVASNPQPGDLVFFRRNGTINHVGLYLGGGKMLHAPQTGSKVRIEDMGRPNWKRRYAGARRALKGEKIVIAANRAAASKSKVPSEKRLAKRAPNSKDSKAKVAAVVKKSKVVTARR